MKKLIILGLIISSSLSCKAQILTIEKKIDYIKAGNGIPESITYIKDVNFILDKFVGVWKGINDTKNYEIRITKYISVYDGLTEDELLLRYVITDANGAVIEDTRALPNDSPYVIESRYYDKLNFVMSYIGRQNKCGQGGELFIEALKSSNYTKMKLFLTPKQGFIDPLECTNGAAKQIFPVNQMLLTKQ